MRNRLRFVLGVSLMTLAVAYLIITSVRNTAEYYLTVAEARTRQSELSGQMIRVAGRVAAGTINWDAATLTLAFTIVQPPDSPGQAGVKPVTSIDAVAPSFRVISQGQPKPDMFAAGRDVIVEGRLGPDNRIAARQVLTSCPSKYVPKQDTSPD
jgi:cytochrome c-type biogenesis protein CcmE